MTVHDTCGYSQLNSYGPAMYEQMAPRQQSCPLKLLTFVGSTLPLTVSLTHMLLHDTLCMGLHG